MHINNKRPRFEGGGLILFRLAAAKKHSIEVETTAKEEYKLLLKPYVFNDK